MRELFFILGFSILISPIFCQQLIPKKYIGSEKLNRILFVLDASNSMYGRWENGTKMEIAQRLLNRTIDSLSEIQDPNFQLALRVYGHQKPVPPQDCNDTRLEVPFNYKNLTRIKQKIKELRPMGTTPIARSILSAAGDFPSCENCRNILVLITDGVEACDEDPCKASKILQKKGILLKPFVIGVGLDPELINSFDCVGSFYDARNENTFKKVLDVIVNQVLNNTSAQINLIGNDGETSETNLPIILKNIKSHKIQNMFIHTLNYKNLPDTLNLDPLIQYEGQVYSIPPVRIDSSYIFSSKHNQLGTEIISGELKLSMPGSKSLQYKPLAIVRQAGKSEILNVQYFNSTTRYLSGAYEIDILTLPRYQEKVLIEPGKIYDFIIPTPGDVSIQLKTSGYGAIFESNGSELEWVINIDDQLTRQKFSLQPGEYILIFGSGSAQQTSYSKTKKFNVSSGISTIVRLP